MTGIPAWPCQQVPAIEDLDIFCSIFELLAVYFDNDCDGRAPALSLPQKLSIGALSKQFPFRLMDDLRPERSIRFLNSWEQY